VKVLVTGGSGFLGRVLVAQLFEGGANEVRVLDPKPFTAHPRATYVRGDVRSLRDVVDAVRGADVVMHGAASVDWGRVPDEILEDIHVRGTENVVEACRREGVGAIVHTSTLDVVYPGGAVRDADESLPYPASFPNGYCRTKADGEKVALAADRAPLDRPSARGARTLRTLAIRPCFVFGEGDPYHIAPLLEMARNGRLIRIGDGSARCQWSYVGNVAHAHVLAARALLEDRAGGEAFFVTDGDAANFFDFVRPFVEAAGYRMPSRGLPPAPLYALGGALEGVARITRPFVRFAPTITRSAVTFVCEDFTVRSDKAERLLGYTPRYSRADAIERTAAHYREGKSLARPKTSS
jgi:nucleoside-diphosphate-sugar epimerase